MSSTKPDESAGEVAFRLRNEVASRSLAEVIRGHLPKAIGFCLLTFDYGSGGHMTFMSSADRGDTIRLLRELAGKLEAEG